MGRKKPGDGSRRRGGRKRRTAGRGQGSDDAAHNRTVAGGASGSSRLLLTRLLREGVIWHVFIATTATAGSPNVVRLEFERAGRGRDRTRYTRPVQGPLLAALHGGSSLSRAELEQELEMAIGEAAGGANAPPPRG